MLPSSATYALALPRSHKRVFTFTSRTPDGTVLAENVQIGGGQITAALTSRVTRSATFTASSDWFPVLPTDPLSPYHAIVEISAGIGYPNGDSEMFSIFKGRVYNASRATNGQVTFRADDLAAEVVAADFEIPENSQLGSSTVFEIQRLITDAYPYATFGTDDVDDARVPPLTWDDDRGKACDDLAAALEGRWYTLGNGDFVVRRYAYTDMTAVKLITDGDGGTLSTASTVVTADDAYNSVVVTSERVDGGEPLRVITREDNPLSPAYFGGNFGKRVRKVRSQSALTITGVQATSRAQLAASTALSRQWSVTCVPDMSLEPGDVVQLSSRGVQDVVAIDSLTYPLSPQTAMSFTARSSIEASVSL